MVDLQRIGRVVYDHDWSHASEWARAVDRLADLTDEQIEGLISGMRAAGGAVPTDNDR
ncbi:MAG: hypothetical protein WAS73_05545 [Defluviicoccus sp.]